MDTSTATLSRMPTTDMDVSVSRKCTEDQPLAAATVSTTPQRVRHVWPEMRSSPGPKTER